MERLPLWQRSIVVIAVLKVALGLGATAAAALGAGAVTPHELLMLAHVVAFGGATLILLFGGRRDYRAVLLGVVLLLVASEFSDPLVHPFQARASPGLTVVRGIFALQVDAFSPFFLWVFAREFPRASPFRTRSTLPGLFILASLGLGVTLFAANALLFLTSETTRFADIHDVLLPFARAGTTGFYWPAQFALSIPALPALLWKTRSAPLDERRRVALLVGGLVAGTAPSLLRVLLVSLSATARRALPLEYAGWIVYPLLLSTPFTTAYAVLVHHALDVRFVVRRAVQYALARQGILTLTFVPFAILLLVLYGERERSISQLMSSADGVVLAGLGILGLSALVRRRPLLEAIDRRFFREQYDSQQILGRLVDQCGRVTSMDELAGIIRTETELALHPDSACVLFLNAPGEVFESRRGDVRPLDATSALADLLARSEGAVDIDLERADTSAASLPERDRAWLVDSGARLALPLKDAERSLVGLLLLGEKKSELPYFSEDRSLLASVASAASLALAYLISQPRRGPAPAEAAAPSPPAEELAAECGVCGALHRAGTAICKRCGGKTAPSAVPLVLAGKFRFIERVGAGSMGVVYRGLDMQLDRPVAIKTLPHLHPDQAVRLRREARAMAALSHPNLALIYGGESWRGLPMLIFEYLGGGTLTERLARGPLTPAQGLQLGVTLADVVRAIHRAGILHRDIKPGNIGFTANEVPKLLDFGVARLIGSPAVVEPGHGIEKLIAQITGEYRIGSEFVLSATPEGQLVGTPLYMSPEAVRSEPPAASFDLWAICMVMYESIAGQHPLKDSSLPRTLARIAACDIPDVRKYAPSADVALAAFFSRVFALDASMRPRTAQALWEELRELDQR